jgi:deazaflavin-dependent oxidoreductase (nitroreductase family)
VLLFFDWVSQVPQTNYIRWIPAPQNIKRIGKVHTWLYVVTRGVIGRRLDGMDVLLLTTIGHRSGVSRRVPLPYFRLGGRTVLVASFGGNPKDPAWIANIQKQPEVKVQAGAKRWDAQARITEGEERAEIWAQLTHEFPRYANYQTLTRRLIPLVVIEPPEA